MKEDTKKALENQVAKNNRLIQHSKSSLTSTTEHKALNFIISKIKPGDNKDKIYKIDCGEFQRILGWGKDATYNKVKDIIKTIADCSTWIEGDLDTGEDILVRWFNIVHIHKGSGIVEISFHPDMWPFLYELAEQKKNGEYFTAYKMKNIALMKSKYSIKLYELLKSYGNRNEWTFENGTGSNSDIQILLSDACIDRKTGKAVPVIPQTWDNWAIFKRNVLDPAVKEINRFTDICVEYEGVKKDRDNNKTRAVKSVAFYFHNKTAAEKKDVQGIIDAKYTVVNEETEEQSVRDRFFQEYESKKISKIKAKDKKNEEPSIYDGVIEMLQEILGEEYTRREIKDIYNKAIYEKIKNDIPSKYWGVAAVDILDYYNKKINNSSKETRTTKLARVKDEIINDYDGYIPDCISNWGNK